MRNPNVILDNLAKKAEESNYTFERLYRNLYNPQFYLAAYNKIYANEGNMTEGVDGKTIDGMSLKKINLLIERMKDESYQPKPVKRTYIPKKNGSKRPLGIPSFEDKLVQEVVRAILESIYEPRFSNNSHGFRPNRSCHTALVQCKERFNGVRWFVEGDIKGFFDNINHNTLINILRRTIKDEKFIRLLYKFLRAGVMENWTYKRSYSGTPQGGIISPILANIYLNELDNYVVKFQKDFEKGKHRKVTSEYEKLRRRVQRFKLKHKERWNELTDEEKAPLVKELKRLQNEVRKVPYSDPMDSNFKRLQYVRYADDFIIGVTGSKEDAQEIKQQLTKFLKDNLGLELSQEKTLVTHSNKKARFLGYDITVSRTQQTKKRSDGAKTRGNSYKCHLYMSRETWVNKLKELEAIDVSKKLWKPKQRTYLINHDDLEIISIYNAEIKGLYEYYKLANNVSALNYFYYFMKYSLLKTFARKYQSSVRKMYRKFTVDGNQLGIKFNTKKGPKTRYFYNEGFHKLKDTRKTSLFNDEEPPKFYFNSRTGPVKRLLANECDICGVKDVPIEMHHVKKLKDLKGKKKWEQHMIARNRKVIPLCYDCHDNLHANKLD